MLQFNYFRFCSNVRKKYTHVQNIDLTTSRKKIYIEFLVIKINKVVYLGFHIGIISKIKKRKRLSVDRLRRYSITENSVNSFGSILKFFITNFP